MVTVEGQDTTPPTIGLDRTIGTIVIGGTFTGPTITVTDNVDPNPTITSQGIDEIDTSTIGEYVVTYTATDANQNSATATYTLNVIGSDFITTWRTTTASESITIPTFGDGYNYTVNWGDGNTTTGHTGNATHSYTKAGDYNISISGTFPRIDFFSSLSDREKLFDIVQWGNNSWKSFNGAFSGSNLGQISATDVPDSSQVTDMLAMFLGAASFNSDISSWDVSNVRDMGHMFRNTDSFNQDLSSWNVSNVESMDDMFAGATSFNSTNYDKLLEAWSQLNLKQNVPFTAPPTYYCNVAARNVLVNTYNWTITGDRQGTAEQCNP